MRLLSAGRSLVGGDDRANRYRLPRRSPMPKFGGDPNPFASTVRPSGPRPSAPADLGPQPAAAAPVMEPAVATVQPTAPEASLSAVPAPAKAAPKAGARWDWLARLNPFRRRPASSPFGFRGRRASTTLPSVRQVELSLATVRVVRNEFSESEEPPPRTRLKGRQLLGRGFPRALPPEEPVSLEDELPIEPTAARPVALAAGQPKLF